MPAEQDALFPGKQFISTVLEALETKTRMTGVIAHRYLMRAAMAGMVVAVFYIVNWPSVPLSSSSTTRSPSGSPAT